MRLSKANLSVRVRLFLSAGGLIAAPLCCYAVLLPGVFRHAYPGAVWLAAMLAVLACAGAVPMLFYFIRGSMAVASGRYHLPLAAATLAGSLATALVFAPPANNLWVASAVVCIALPVSAVSLLLFLFLYRAVRGKLIGEGDKCFPVFLTAAESLGAVAFFTAFAFSFGFMRTEFLAVTGQICAALFLLAGVSVFVSSVSYMPRFIRLRPPAKRTVSQQYKSFFAPLFYKSNILPLVGHFVSAAAVLLGTLSVFLFPAARSAPAIVLFLGAWVVCFAGFGHFGQRLIKPASVFIVAFFGGIGVLAGAYWRGRLRQRSDARFLTAPPLLPDCCSYFRARAWARAAGFPAPLRAIVRRRSRQTHPRTAERSECCFTFCRRQPLSPRS